MNQRQTTIMVVQSLSLHWGWVKMASLFPKGFILGQTPEGIHAVSSHKCTTISTLIDCSLFFVYQFTTLDNPLSFQNLLHPSINLFCYFYSSSKVLENSDIHTTLVSLICSVCIHCII